MHDVNLVFNSFVFIYCCFGVRLHFRWLTSHAVTVRMMYFTFCWRYYMSELKMKGKSRDLVTFFNKSSEKKQLQREREREPPGSSSSCCGASGIFSNMHLNTFSDIIQKPVLRKFIIKTWKKFNLLTEFLLFCHSRWFRQKDTRTTSRDRAATRMSNLKRSWRHTSFICYTLIHQQ